MAKFFNTVNKRTITAIAMGITGYFVLANTLGWTFPEFLSNDIVAGFNVVSIAAAYMLFSIYLLLDNQLNG